VAAVVGIIVALAIRDWGIPWWAGILLGLCDRIYTIFEGRVTGVLDREQADQEALMRLMTGTSPALTN